MNYKTIPYTLALLMASYYSTACTTILMGKNTTFDGSVLLAHNEDMGFEAKGKIWHKNSMNYAKDHQISIPYIDYSFSHTNAYWASGITKDAIGLGIKSNAGDYQNILVGLNEYGLAMACNWMNSKDEAVLKKGINRFAIRQLILEACRSAHEAVILIGSLIDQYGQADWGGLTYCVADNTEAWIVETTASQWVARKIGDNEIHTVANRYTIEDSFDLHSKNLYDYAIERGWFIKNETFNFRQVYGREGFIENDYDKKREERVQDLLSYKNGIISITDVFEVLRDRYEGTDDFSLPVTDECWRDYCEKNNVTRTISTNVTQSSSVAHLRNNMPREMAFIMWYSMATPNFSGYFPIYSTASTIPDIYSDDGIHSNNAWKLFKQLQIEGDKDYKRNIIVSNLFWKSSERGFINKLNQLENKMRTDYSLAEKITNQFTSSCAKDVLLAQKKLIGALSN